MGVISIRMRAEARSVGSQSQGTVRTLVVDVVVNANSCAGRWALDA